MARNWKYYIDHDDFEGALERFNNAYKNWKQHWFDVCQEIYSASAKWAKKYILDPIALTISKVGQIITKKQKGMQSCAYVVKVFDYVENKSWLKVGKADDIYKRYYSDKKYDLSEIYRTYWFNSSDKAQAMEDVARAFFKEFFPNEHKPLDRFNFQILSEITDEMWEILDNKVVEINKIFEFGY
jgi:hypothetical protein